MRKCEICGKTSERLLIVQIAEFETIQVCEDCHDSGDGVINIIEGE